MRRQNNWKGQQLQIGKSGLQVVWLSSFSAVLAKALNPTGGSFQKLNSDDFSFFRPINWRFLRWDVYISFAEEKSAKKRQSFASYRNWPIRMFMYAWIIALLIEENWLMWVLGLKNCQYWWKTKTHRFDSLSNSILLQYISPAKQISLGNAHKILHFQICSAPNFYVRTILFWSFGKV